MRRVILLAVFVLSAGSYLSSCDSGPTAPDVGPFEVGFINKTRESLVWGIRWENISVLVKPKKTAVLPYMDREYYIDIFSTDLEERWEGQIFMRVSPGETIEAYQEGTTIKARIKYRQL